MSTPLRHRLLWVALAAAAVLPTTASAHRSWMLPSSTIVAGKEPWISVDAAVSNDVFYFEHNALNVDTVAVIQPDGSAGKVENPAKGRYRSVFDVKLPMPGTYKVALVNDMMTASFKVGEETKRLRGTRESLAKDIPAEAQDLRVNQAASRMEFFVTSGSPTRETLKPSGRGLEMEPVTHPNDLVAGETAKFRFLVNGKPTAGLNVLLIPGGNRYRDALNELRFTTDAKGEIQVKWPSAGMYWLNASPVQPGGPGGDAMSGGPGAAPGGAPAGGTPPRPMGPAGTLDKPEVRMGYTATLEVMAP